MKDENIKTELYRYIAIPGQALSYKLGEREFIRLKNKLKTTEKHFHNKIFKKGPMPLFLLKNIK